MKGTEKINENPYFNLTEINGIVISYLPGANEKTIDDVTNTVATILEIKLFNTVRNIVTDYKKYEAKKDLIV